MKPTTIKLLKDNPEECKEIADLLMKKWYATPGHFDKVWGEFLKEHTKPDWEILEFKNSLGQTLNMFPNKLYGSFQGCMTLDECIRDRLTIHSVRRSDGEVFTVGDKTNQGIIEKFEISDRCMSGMYAIFGNGKWSIDYLTKLQPLFKTEDGVDYYKGDGSLWEVFGENMDHISEVRIAFNELMEGLKKRNRLAFSTREAAEKWVEEHRPSVSIAQIREFAEKDLPFQTVEALLLHLKSKK